MPTTIISLYQSVPVSAFW